MAADDLIAPLRRAGARRTPAKRGRRRYAIATLLLAGLVGTAVWLFAWPLLQHDPQRDDPIAVAEPSADAPAMRESLSAEAEDDVPEPAPANDDVVKVAIHGGIVGEGQTAAQAGQAGQSTASLGPKPFPSKPLAKAPDPGLIEASVHGALPRIGEDGRRPAQVYARPTGASPAAADNGPRIAILVTGLGIAARSTEAAIGRLAGPVSLAFAPYGKDLQTWVDKARARGHEVALQLPMEPFGYPEADPGPHTMVTDAGPAENIQRLRWLLARMGGYFAITNYMGARFTGSSQALSPVLEEAERRGLAYIDDGSSPRSQAVSVAGNLGLPAVSGDVIIDAGQSPESVEAALDRLEALARRRGQAIGVATALPSTIDAIAAWAQGLAGRGFVLTPVSALMPQPSRS